MHTVFPLNHETNPFILKVSPALSANITDVYEVSVEPDSIDVNVDIVYPPSPTNVALNTSNATPVPFIHVPSLASEPYVYDPGENVSLYVGNTVVPTSLVELVTDATNDGYSIIASS